MRCLITTFQMGQKSATAVNPGCVAGSQHSPSNGFINASLAMVAEEPLTAYTCQRPIYPQYPKGHESLTSRQRMMPLIHIPPSKLLDNFICTKVNRMCRTYITGEKKPHVSLNPFSALDCLFAVYISIPAPTITLETPFHSVLQPSMR